MPRHKSALAHPFIQSWGSVIWLPHDLLHHQKHLQSWACVGLCVCKHTVSWHWKVAWMFVYKLRTGWCTHISVCTCSQLSLLWFTPYNTSHHPTHSLLLKANSMGLSQPPPFSLIPFFLLSSCSAPPPSDWSWAAAQRGPSAHSSSSIFLLGPPFTLTTTDPFPL